MAQWLKAFPALPEDLSSVPSTHVEQLIMTYKFNSLRSSALFCSPWVPAYTWRILTQIHIPIYTFKKYTVNTKDPLYVHLFGAFPKVCTVIFVVVIFNKDTLKSKIVVTDLWRQCTLPQVVYNKTITSNQSHVIYLIKLEVANTRIQNKVIGDKWGLAMIQCL